MKKVVITSHTLQRFYNAGVYQTIFAYASAFKGLGYEVKMVMEDASFNECVEDQTMPFIWHGIEYFSMSALLDEEDIDYFILMGVSDRLVEEGGTGLIECLREKHKDLKVIYSSFYNPIARLNDMVSDSEGYLIHSDIEVSKAFDECWILESHNYHSLSYLSNFYKKVRDIPLIALRSHEYLDYFKNTKIAPLESHQFSYSLENVNKGIVLNLDPGSQYKNALFVIIASLKWLREQEGRGIAIGNALPLWVDSNGNNSKAHTHFKKLLNASLSKQEFFNVTKQSASSLIKFYDRRPTLKALEQTGAFAVVINKNIQWIEKWNLLLMDLFAMGVPVIHNFEEIDVGWKFSFPDAESLDKAIRNCYEDLFEKNQYENYCEAANECYLNLSSFNRNKSKLEVLLD